MKRVLALVEGQTEEQFIKLLVNPCLEAMGILMTPIILKSKRVVNGPDFRGGIIPYPRAKKQIIELLNDKDAVAVTTMFDYYGLDDSFPGKKTINEIKSVSCYEKVLHFESSLGEDIGNHRFIPYLALHEFEALLFSVPEKIVSTLIGETEPNYKKAKEVLINIKNQFENPEEINDNPKTCPNKRISEAIPNYDKFVYGNLVAMEIGIDTMKKECRHFCEWMEKIARLGN